MDQQVGDVLAFPSAPQGEDIEPQGVVLGPAATSSWPSRMSAVFFSQLLCAPIWLIRACLVGSQAQVPLKAQGGTGPVMRSLFLAFSAWSHSISLSAAAASSRPSRPAGVDGRRISL